VTVVVSGDRWMEVWGIYEFGFGRDGTSNKNRSIICHAIFIFWREEISESKIHHSRINTFNVEPNLKYMTKNMIPDIKQ
jgi:hypothetical protein